MLFLSTEKVKVEKQAAFQADSMQVAAQVNRTVYVCWAQARESHAVMC